MPTKAELQQQCNDYNNILGEKAATINELQAKLDLAEKRAARSDERVATLEANRIHHIAMLEQMRGFIRAHHTEKIPTGAFTSEYNPTTGQYDNVPIITERYPFMDIVTETFER